MHRRTSICSGSANAANFLARQRAKQPTTLELLQDLTRRIPDSTSLEKISVNDGNMVLTAIVNRQDGTMISLLSEMRAIRSQLDCSAPM